MALVFINKHCWIKCMLLRSCQVLPHL